MRVGIVGTNFVSDMFMDAVKQVPQLEPFGVASGHYEHAIAFARKYSLERIYPSYQEMLADERVDAVYLAVPNSLHHDMCIPAIAARKNIIVEKPFMVTVQEAQDIFERAQKRPVFVHDAIVPLYTQSFRNAKDALASIGRIRHASFAYHKYSSRYDAYLRGENPTTFRKELCNGALMDLGVYCIADMVGLFGRPQTIQAHCVKLDSGVDGTVDALCHYDGFDASISASKISDGHSCCVIEGEQGTIVMESPGRLDHVLLRDRLSREEKDLSGSSVNPFTEQLQDFAENVREERRESGMVPHSLTLEILDVMAQIRKEAGIVFEGKD